MQKVQLLHNNIFTVLRKPTTFIKALCLLLLVGFFGLEEVKGQINITAGGSAVTQNFNSLGASSTAALPTDWTVQKSTTERTIPNFSSTATNVDYAGGNSIATNVSNGIYRFNANNSTSESAIGGISSTSLSKTVALYSRLKNNSSTPIASFTISYNVEKYRNGTNSAGYSIELFYSTDGTSWTSCGSNFLTSFAADVDNNGYATAPTSSTAVSSKTFTPTSSIAQNTVFYFAWRYSVTTGSTTSNAQALGVDDISITANAASTNFFWNGGTTSGAGAATGGSGTWNTSTTNWISPTNDASGTSTAWTNSTSNVANFSNGSGTVSVSGTLYSASAVNVNTSYTFNPTAATTITAPVAIAASQTLTATPSASNSLTIAGAITGSGALTVNGGGTGTNAGGSLILNTTGSSYSGATTIGGSNQNAQLQLNAVGTPSASSITISNNSQLQLTNSGTYTNSGTLTINGAGNSTNSGAIRTTGTGTSTWAGNVTLGSASTITSTSGTQLNITGVLALGANTLTVAGQGTLNLSGNNTGSANSSITVTNGTLQLGSATGIPFNTAVNLDGTSNAVTFDVNGNNENMGSLSSTSTAFARTVTNSSATAATLSIGNDNLSQTFAGVIQNGTGVLNLTKAGTGTQTFSGANTYSGGTVITGGTLAVSAENNLGATPGSVSATNITLGGGTLGTTASFTLNSNRGITLTTSTSSGIDVASGTQLTYNGIIAGSGNITKTSVGNLVLGGNSTYTGTTTINAGTLFLGGAGSGSNTPLGTTAGSTTVSSGAALDVNGYTLATAEALTLNGTGVNGFGALTNSSSTAATYSGLVTLGSNATIASSFGALTLSNTGTITGSGFGFTLGGSTGGTVNSIIGTGAGTVTKAGSGTWTLTANNTYTGTTTVSAGELRLNPSSTSASLASTQVYLDGGTFSTTGIAASTTLTCSGTLNLNANTTIALGSNVHSLIFAASNGITWNGTTLTITGWTGNAGVSGTGGKIFVGNSNSGLTSAQLAKINFSGYNNGAVILSTGEIVPIPSTPTTTDISPSSATAGGSSFTITVNGSNFISGISTVTWNGSNRTTTFVTSGQLTATINAADIVSAGTATVGVTTTNAPAASNTQTFTIDAAANPSFAITGTTNHGSVCPNTSASSIQYTITNNGTAATNVVVASSDAQFVVSNLSATSIAAGATATFDVVFTPSSAGAKSATITVFYNTNASGGTIGLTGTGTTPVTQAVTVQAASSINSSSAILNGNLTTLGVCPATIEKGFVYALTATNSNPTVGGTGVTKQAVSGISTGSFSFTLSTAAATGYTYNSYAYDGTSYTYGATASSFTSLSTAPTTQPTGISRSAVSITGMSLSWTAASGGASGYIVLRTTAAGTTYPNTNPVSGTAYTVGTTLGNATVEYVGSSLTAAINSILTFASQYSYSIYSYNGSGASIAYNTTTPLQGQFYTLGTTPTTQSSLAFTSATATSVTMAITSGNGVSNLIVASAGSAVTQNPVNGATGYSGGANVFGAGTNLGSNNYIVMMASTATTSVTVTGLTAGTTYYFSIFSYNGVNGTDISTGILADNANYLTTSPGTLSVTPLSAPVATAATPIGVNGFTANWGAVTGATNYALDVYTTASTVITEAFATSVPTGNGWSGTATGGYTSAGNFGNASPSTGFANSGETLISPTLSGSATQLSFWLKGQGTNASSALLVEGFNGTSWVTIQNITNSIPITATTYTYNSSTTPALPSNIVRFRFTYTKSSGNLAFDDVAITYNNTTSILTNQTTGNFTSYPVTGLAGGTTYYYVVRAVAGSNTSSNSNTITVTTNPPIYYSKSTGNLDALATWGTNTDGSGTAPTNFTTNGATYNIVNNATPTLGAAWTVSGTSSKVVLGDGTASINFTIPSGFAYTGTMDVAANSTLTIQNTTIPTFGTISTSSTINYAASSGTQAITAATYGNLTLSGGGTKSFPSGTVTIAGTFTPGTGFSATQGTIDFSSSSAQTIPAFTYFNLTNSGNGARTYANGGTVTIAGATHSPSNGTNTVTGNTLVYSTTSTGLALSSFTYNNLQFTGSGSGWSIADGSTITVLGNLSVAIGSSGTFYVNAGSTTSVSSTLNVAGSFTLTSGIFSVSYGYGVGNLTVGGLATVAGTLKVLDGYSTTPSTTVNFNGGLTVSGSGSILMESVSSTSGVATINVTGNFTSTSTSSAVVNFGASGATVTNNAINISGNFSKSGTGTFTTSASGAATGFVMTGGTSATPATFSYAGATSNFTQYTVGSGAYVQMQTSLTLGSSSNPASTFTVSSTGTLDFLTYSIIAGGTTNPQFITSSGSTLITSNTNGLGGTTTSGSLQSFGSVNTISAAGRATFASGVNYVFNATTTTPFPAGLTVTATNITLGANITINRPITVNNTLAVNSYVLTSNASNITFSSITGSGSINSDNATYITCSGSNGAAGTLNLAIGGQSVALLTMNRAGQTLILGSNITLDGILDPTNAGRLVLTSGTVDASGDQLTFINGNTPISVTTGTLTTNNATTLIFGTTGNTGGNSFTIPAATFTTANPVINTLTINRTNALSLNTQGLYIQNGALNLTAGNLNLGSGCTLELNAANLNVNSSTLTGSTTSDLTISGTSGNTVTIPGAISLRNISVTGTRTLALNGTNNLSLNGVLDIGSTATFDNGGESQITNGGSGSINLSGKFITRDVQGFVGTNTAIPGITPTINSGSTVEYALNGDQTVQASVSYANLTLSGSGTKTPTNAVTIGSTLTISGSAILDGRSNTIGASGTNLTMTGTSKFLVGGTSGTRPTIAGTYSLANTSTIEFAGSGVSIRQGSPSINYGNIIVSGSDITAPLTGLTLQSGSTFTVSSSGTLNVSSTGGLSGAASNVAILNTNNPTVTLSSGSTINYNGVGAQTVSARTDYSNLTINGSGIKSLAGTTTVGSTLTLTVGTLALGSNTLTLNGTYIAGTVNNLTTTASSNLIFNTTTAGTLPNFTAINNLTCNSTGNTFALNSSPTVSGTLALTAGTLSLGSYTLTINGNVTGTGVLRGSTTAALVMGSASSGTLYFDQTTATGKDVSVLTNALNNLTINGGTITIGNHLSLVNGFVHLNGGTLALTGNIVLKSAVGSHAQVGTVAGTINYSGGGRFVIERYVNSTKRGYRNLASGGVVSDAFMFENWQESGDNTSTYGMHITGKKGAGVDATTGLDQTTSGNSSVWGYSTTDSWLAVTNTKTEKLYPFKGYFATVRGNRTYNLFNPSPDMFAANTTLRVTGKLVTGTVTLSSEADASYTTDASTTIPFRLSKYVTPNGKSVNDFGFSLVANPYACAIDWNSVYNNSGTTKATISPYYWVWNQAANGGSGAWVTVDTDGFNNTSNSSLNNKWIQPGQSFFIKNDNSGSAVSLEFKETDKYISDNGKLKDVLDANSGSQKLAISLLRVDTKDTINTDGLLIAFDSTYNNKIDINDAGKFNNFSENIAIAHGNETLSIEKRALPTIADSLQLRIWTVTAKANYILQVDARGYNADLNPAVLDKQTNKILTASNDGLIAIPFVPTTDTATYLNRFVVVFVKADVLPVTNIVLKATFKNGQTALQWLAPGESKTDKLGKYEVQTSNNNNTYTTVATLLQNGSGNYAYALDEAVPYARIRLVHADGSWIYSNVVSLKQEEPQKIKLYPTLVKGSNHTSAIHIALTNVASNTYQLAVYDVAGKKVQEQSLQHNGLNGVHTIQLNALPSGSYRVIVSGAKVTLLNQPIVVE